MKTAVIVTTYNRPACLARSLPQICAAAREVGAPVLVVDDGSVMTEAVPGFDEIVMRQPRTGLGATWIWLPENRGLAGALNIGLSYFLADPDIEAIHAVQDDVEIDVLAFAACNEVLAATPNSDEGRDFDVIVTAHDAAEHHAKTHSKIVDSPATQGNVWPFAWHGDGEIVKGIKIRRRPSCRLTHVAMKREAWISLMPIPSRGLGLPGTKTMDGNRGTGSGADWHLCRDSKNAKPVLCIPGLLRSFAHKAADSTWLNESIGGEEPPLSRASIQEWVNARS
jgi:hypothetical protein